MIRKSEVTEKRICMDLKKRGIFFWLEIVLIALLFCGSYLAGGYVKRSKSEINYKNEIYLSTHAGNMVDIRNDQGIIVDTKMVHYDDLITDYHNILVVGVDARNQSFLDGGTNADVIMIVSIHKDSGSIRLVSVLRDTLLRLENPGKVHPGRIYDKANSQICYTNISDMISMINYNLDLNIEDYVVVNWRAAAKIIDAIDGIEVTIDNPEVIRYMNSYLTEVNAETGIWSSQLSGPGTYILTGTQAVAFCRVRYAGLGDIGRTSNQRMVMEQCLDKVKRMLWSKPVKIASAVNAAMESISTNMSLLELGNLVFQAQDFNLEGNAAFPFVYEAGEYIGQIYEATGGVKDTVVAKNLADNVILLHQYLYPEAAYAYQLPEEVRSNSDQIALISGVK